MPTKKQARAAQKRRHEQYEARLAVRQARRRRRQQIVSALAAGSLVLGGGIVALTSLNSAPATPSPSPTPSTTSPQLGPPSGYAEGREWTATIETGQGTLTVRLDGALAPQAVGSFVYLARQGYFDDTSCHRLVTEGIFVLQCGDPTETGTGGPDYRFGPVENAPSDDIYPAGTIAMARASNDGYSMGSQFFIVYQDSTISSDLAGGYTIFGTVTDGLDIVEAIAAAGTETGLSDGRPAEPVILHEVSVS
ncbi:MAG: peptidylprolyl isomerase [Demequinaceae bacterium]|nr:peptidylprolyl isomerase [Demequinaceae bacterium]